MNIRTPFDVFYSTFWTIWKEHQDDGKDFTFDTFCGLLIIDQNNLLDGAKFGRKHQAHFIKGKGKMNYKERGHSDALVCR
jgi:hypothetical protein